MRALPELLVCVGSCGLVRGCGGAVVLAVVVYVSSEAARSHPVNFLPLPR